MPDTTPEPSPGIRFCGGCGSSAVAFDGTKLFTCPACGWHFYHNAAAATVAVITVGDTTVFTRRRRDPAAGMLDLPGGFTDAHESAEEAVLRELHEELGLELAPSSLSYLGSIPNVYPYRAVTYQTVDLFYRVLLETVPEVHDADEIAEVVALRNDEIDLAEIGLRSIREGVARWVLGPGRQAV